MGDWPIASDPRDRPNLTLRPGSPRWWLTSRTTGRITVAQVPNPVLVLAAVTALGARLFDGHHGASRVLSDVATGAVVVWSLDELVRGVNPWRRVLGVVVLSVAVISTVRR